MARLSLFAPPAGVIIVIPFTYNVLKRHPALMCMIHRPEMGGIEDELDPFDPEEKDPMQTKALQSSLWELTTHRQHYHASVATLARVFEEAFTRPGFAMEDFLDHTYTTVSSFSSLLHFLERCRVTPFLFLCSFLRQRPRGGYGKNLLFWIRNLRNRLLLGFRMPQTMRPCNPMLSVYCGDFDRTNIIFICHNSLVMEFSYYAELRTPCLSS